MLIKQLNNLTGGLSRPSKMPCFGYSIPARKCKVGKKLNKIKGTVCEKCYALKGRYSFPLVQNALDRRSNTIYKPLWVSWMVELIGRKEKSGFFRWHDSGDIQSERHLKNICDVAVGLPKIKFWLPTKEIGIVKSYIEKGNVIPSNLCVRLSEYYLGDNPKNSIVRNLAKDLNMTISGVGNPYNCPAPKQDGQCGKCRLCWNPKHFNTTYKFH